MTPSLHKRGTQEPGPERGGRHGRKALQAPGGSPAHASGEPGCRRQDLHVHGSEAAPRPAVLAAWQHHAPLFWLPHPRALSPIGGRRQRLSWRLACQEVRHTLGWSHKGAAAPARRLALKLQMGRVESGCMQRWGAAVLRCHRCELCLRKHGVPDRARLAASSREGRLSPCQRRTKQHALRPPPPHLLLQRHAGQRAVHPLQVRPVAGLYRHHQRRVGPLGIAPAGRKDAEHD